MPVRPVPAPLWACTLPALLVACSSRPGTSPVQAVPAPAATAPATDQPPNRFEMTRDGKRMTADDFDAWMQARGIRVAGGKTADDEVRPAVSPAKAKAGASGRGGTARR